MNTSEQRPRPGRNGQYHFGDFVLDAEGGFLRRGAEEVPLQPRAFHVLMFLVERHGRLVKKDELIDAVWGETAVTDNSLSQCLVQIRRALADDSQQIIRTVARRGYVFGAPVTASVLEFPREADQAGIADSLSAPPQQWYRRVPGTAVVILAVAAAVLLYALLPLRNSKFEPVYTQLTNFSDSASAPALSSDGRMVAFFKGNSQFAAKGPIYAKILPNGEAVQITRDARNKYGLAFSPDGSQISYTAWQNDSASQWQTFTVPTLGGEPRLLLANAAGLTWLNDRTLLFSRVKTGLHMGIVTSDVNFSNIRPVYFPEHERRMAHYSYASPDRKWALVVEMEPGWLPCRIIPMEGSSPGRQVGPGGECTAAAWSPDGKWMYFGAATSGARHLWRQHFPNGEAEPITFGPAEEEGLAVAPDGSLITSVGVRDSAVWIHNSKGERPISVEGYAASNYLLLSPPQFSRDGSQLYYLLQRQSPGSGNELWRANLDSDTSERLFVDFNIFEFDISGDGTGAGEVVFSSQPPGKPSQLWLAPLDRSAPPKRIAASGEGSPHFGPDGTVRFRYSNGKANYIGQIKKDGSNRKQITPYPISTFLSSSPDGRWLIALAPASDRAAADTMAIPTEDVGRPHRVCRGFCPTVWAPNRKTLYIALEGGTGKTVAIPLSAGEFPEVPAGLVESPEKAMEVPGARLIDKWNIAPSPDPSTFAWVKTKAGNRNLFRISLR
jgi:DNA-binding winged helix-turn-helix (wHTH) protein/Tol biopolymer transport system component